MPVCLARGHAHFTGHVAERLQSLEVGLFYFLSGREDFVQLFLQRNWVGQCVPVLDTTFFQQVRMDLAEMGLEEYCIPMINRHDVNKLVLEISWKVD